MLAHGYHRDTGPQPGTGAHRAGVVKHHRTGGAALARQLDFREDVALTDRPVGVDVAGTGEVYLILGGRRVEQSVRLWLLADYDRGLAVGAERHLEAVVHPVFGTPLRVKRSEHLVWGVT
jgi:hypothetical protein